MYFPTAGFISLIVTLDNGAQLEVGIIGNEGMLGSALTLDVSVSPQLAIVQGVGTALRMSAPAFRRQCQQNAKLRERLARYVYVSMRQLAQMSACTRYHQVEARLARRLLMSRDCAGANELHLTHEFLASTLGVRRVGITQAARALQARGLIRYSRGDITITDGAGLEIRSCECYGRGNHMYAQGLDSLRTRSNSCMRPSARGPPT
ncbi:Crp/Fnr family transcriptional regulator [Steroidobacter sp. S1-65]|uniref:Crp/Fnr family transcriptional regulator n=1 Tax=Steroidobacter gossypii TaxID=2805490 RepID=A0ABS1WVI3_9GAMM|nr:Crp/Fnr family transcriptional regulator [Steroidobacter gossypii]